MARERAGRVMMDGKELNELRELVEFLKVNGVAEFDMEREDLKVRLKFTGPASTGVDAAQLARLLASAGSHGGGENTHSLGAPVLAAASMQGSAAAAPAEPEEKLHEVKSPIVGTFYESPSPGAPAFVKPGDQIEVGQVLCIVEAMKLMNEIEADIAGEVVKRIAASGQPVEYGQPLFVIRPR
jgi:acetyl-CoA carboxylase biotin carboxyl carrier protein